MLIISKLDEFTASSPTSVALGRFDGVHLAHKKVIEAAVGFEHTLPTVFTFEQSPHGVLTGDMVYSLQTLKQRRDMIESLGVQLYVCPNFNDVRDMLPEEFVLMLKERLNVKHISCGFNFTFGKYGKGNAAVLKEICAKYDIALSVAAPIESNGEPVSSSAIRRFIENGDMQQASDMLGYRFYIDFPVLSGDKRGRTLDFPTINQKIPHTFIHPKYGVYATKTLVGGKWYKSVSNVGVRPTVGSDYPRCETFILGYSGDLYGDSVKVEFYRFLRPEQTFSDLNELQAAIANDANTALTEIY